MKTAAEPLVCVCVWVCVCLCVGVCVSVCGCVCLWRACINGVPDTKALWAWKLPRMLTDRAS